ncbi:MAG: hypothetical protein KGL46_13295 [Hyphomicrobiales bacterium]|nr:hypothetical protein [Hyphomicrobiales bacterium]
MTAKARLSQGPLAGLALVLLMLALRALSDKMLALRVDADFFGKWAQAVSFYDLPATVALQGVGQGLTVLAARERGSLSHAIKEAALLGLGVAGVAALALLIIAPLLDGWTGLPLAPERSVLAISALGGTISVIPGLAACYWTGRRARIWLLALSLAGWAPMALASAGLFGAPTVLLMQATQLAVVALLALLLVFARRDVARAPVDLRASALARYIPAGVSIGVLSPLSNIWARAELARNLSWADVSQWHTLGRTEEWVMGVAGGLIGLVVMPRMAEAAAHGDLRAEFSRAALRLWAPTTMALMLLWFALPVLTPVLYNNALTAPRAAAAAFFAGDALRVLSWIGLQGLFATAQVKAVAWGELLSLPLFAALLTIAAPHSLAGAGLCYLAAYVVYAIFNASCLLRFQPARSSGAASS